MGAKVSWYIEDRIILNYYWGEITNEELENSSKQSTEWIRSASDQVHSIVHTLDVTGYPVNLAQGLKLAAVVRNSNLGWMIMLSDDRMARFMASAVSQITRFRFRAVATEQEALEFLMDVDPSLPDLPSLEEFLAQDQIT